MEVLTQENKGSKDQNGIPKSTTTTIYRAEKSIDFSVLDSWN